MTKEKGPKSSTTARRKGFQAAVCEMYHTHDLAHALAVFRMTRKRRVRRGNLSFHAGS